MDHTKQRLSQADMDTVVGIEDKISEEEWAQFKRIWRDLVT